MDILDILSILVIIFIIMTLTTIVMIGISFFIIFVFEFCMKIAEKYEEFLNQLFS